MAFVSIKKLLESADLATAEQYAEWCKAWRIAFENGSEDSLLAFMAREAGITEEQFMTRLAKAMDWPFVELGSLDIPPEAREKISTKVAFQYNVIPTAVVEGVLQVAISNPFNPTSITSLNSTLQTLGTSLMMFNLFRQFQSLLQPTIRLFGNHTTKLIHQCSM